MSSHSFTNGIIIEFDDSEWTAHEVRPGPALRGSPRGLPRGPVLLGVGGADDPLTHALAGQGLERTEVFEVTPVRRGPASEPKIRVPVRPDEHAVVLVEREGVYTWILPEPASKGSRLRGGSSFTPREEIFRLPAGPSHHSRGVSVQGVAASVRALVFRFVARAITPVAIAFLERKVRVGLVELSGIDPRGWLPQDDVAPVRSSSPRVLLFVHGTFSSTVGSYHGLAAVSEGQELLGWAREYYDEIIGYDHKTLSLDPEENARDLLQRLAARYGDSVPRLDVIAFSRGGLVARTLVQRLLPASPWRPRIERLVMVGCTNRGTRLAEPKNWRAFVDLHTNLATAALNAVGAAIGADLLTFILGEAIRSLGALIKYLVLHTLEEQGVPGLAAMQPEGAFVAALNEPGAWPSTAGCECFIVRSEYEPTLNPTDAPGSMSRALRDWLIDHVADGLLGVANDLVVDTGAMTPTSPGVAELVRDVLDYGKNAWIHHLCYFTHSWTAAAIRRWLAVDGSARAPASALDESVWVVDADDVFGDLLRVMARDPARTVVVQRRHGHKRLHYVFTTAEIHQHLGRARPQFSEPERETVRVVLQLHEYTATPAFDPNAAPCAVARVVPVLAEGRVVGVVHPPSQLEGPRLAPLAPPLTRTIGPFRGADPRMHWRGTPALERVTLPPARLEVRAEMPEVLAAQEVFELHVLLSREALAATLVSTAAASASIVADPQQRLRISVSPRSNLEFDSPTFVDVVFPDPDNLLEVAFPGRALAEGPAEVWVFVRQGRLALARLAVQGRVVAAESRPSASPRVRARADVAPDVELVRESPFTLRVFEVPVGHDLRLHFELEALGLNERLTGISPQLGDIADYVRKLYAEIEDCWIATAKDARSFRRMLRAHGAQLFRSLLPRNLQDALWRHRANLREILVLSTETHIPWELMHPCDPATGALPAESQFLAQKGLLRWLHNVPVQPRRLRLRSDKVRHVVPNYPGSYALPGAREEADFLARQFGSRALDPANAEDLYELLEQDDDFDLLHFAGHGEAAENDIAQSRLLMAGHVQGGQWYPDHALALAIRSLSFNGAESNNRPLVFLNACQVGRQGRALGTLGGFVAAFLARRAGIFIAPLWSVGDHHAFTFGKKLYEGLSSNLTLAQAVVAARDAAAKDPSDMSWLAYAVYGDHEARLERPAAPSV